MRWVATGLHWLGKQNQERRKRESQGWKIHSMGQADAFLMPLFSYLSKKMLHLAQIKRVNIVVKRFGCWSPLLSANGYYKTTDSCKVVNNFLINVAKDYEFLNLLNEL